MAIMIRSLSFCVLAYLLIIFLTGCGDSSANLGNCAIETSFFTIIAPCNVKHVNMKSIDSYIGKIYLDYYEIDYDYGPYNNPDKARTMRQYILKDRWIGDAIDILPLEAGREYNANVIIQKIKILDRNLEDNIVTFSYENNIYHYKVNVPNNIRLTQESEDIIDNIRRPVYIYHSDKSGVGKIDFQVLILRDENTEPDTISLPSNLSLSLYVKGVKPDDSLQIRQILKTVKLIN